MGSLYTVIFFPPDSQICHIFEIQIIVFFLSKDFIVYKMQDRMKFLWKLR